MVVDELWGGTKELARTSIMLLVLVVLGGVLAGVGDMALGSALVGTPLGPSSTWSPVLWTVVAGVVLYGVNEVRS